MTIPTIAHAGELENLTALPAYLAPDHCTDHPMSGRYSCAFCGVGNSGLSVAEHDGGITSGRLDEISPTSGCAKLLLSTVRQRPAFPIHLAPSIIDGGARRAISYQEAIRRLADLVLDHLTPHGRTLVYACGQVDYFTVFAIQEVFRLLGVRNLAGNAEHCLNAAAIYNEILTGQEGPFVTIDQALRGGAGEERLYLLNGWNGRVTHPPAFRELLARDGLDAYLIEVQITETAREVAERLGPERVLLVRPRSDPMLAMAVIHEILTSHTDAIDQRFLERFADHNSFASLRERAADPRFGRTEVASRIAAEPAGVEGLSTAIRRIAAMIARDGVVPVNIPSVGLSQSSGVVAHCLWASAFALVGKYGLRKDGLLAGGTLRLPGQINAQSEVQGLNRNIFMGRIGMEHHADAARRMGLDADAYARVLEDEPRPALDYSEPTGCKELFLFIGTQFEANMMQRRRWLDKLSDPNVRFVVIDPIPDPYTVDHAELIIPSPPHPATTKLYQNGEWRLSLGTPQKRAAPETRSDATILYDLMAEITHRVEHDEAVARSYPELGQLAAKGYLQERFCDPGLPRVGGEVSRPHLWERIGQYMSGGSGPLYCRPEHADGRPVSWNELLAGSVVYGGVGSSRYRLDYDQADAAPFADIYRRPGRFHFFTPTDDDLRVPEGVILNSGRSSLSDDPAAIRFATNTFNSGKATPLAGMPDENPLFISPSLAGRHGLRDGDRVRVVGRETGERIEVPVVVTDRVKGETTYMSFHKSRAQLDSGVYVNDVTEQRGRCAYSGQTSLKTTVVTLERIAPTGAPSPKAAAEPPPWNGHQPLELIDVITEAADVVTFRFRSDPPSRFVYRPGQFVSLRLRIDGELAVRSYSISSAPTRPGSVDITVKRVPGGLASNWLIDNLKPGDRVDASGPHGTFGLPPGRVPGKLLLIGAGSGITPLMSISRWLCDTSSDTDVILLNSVTSTRDVIFEAEIEHLRTTNPCFRPTITVTREDPAGTDFHRGRINRALIEATAPDLHERHVLLCGPAEFMDVTREILADLEFDPGNLHSESFGRPSRPEQHGAGTVDVSFALSGRAVRTHGSAPLLEVAESAGVTIDFACRTGSCGACRVRLLTGEVTTSSDDALTAGEHADGYVLACVSRPDTDCTIDA